MTHLTQALLKSLLRYDPDTGLFTRLVQRGGRQGLSPVVGTAHPKGYIRVNISQRGYYAHRLAFLYMTGRWPHPCVDHINGNRADNRWANLREATHEQNSANFLIVRKRTMPRGVRKYFHKYEAKYGRIYLGLFRTLKEAERAVIKHAIDRGVARFFPTANDPGTT